MYHGRELKPNTALISYYINVEEERKRSFLIFDPLTLILEGLRDNWVIVRHTDTITVTYDADGNIVRYDRPRAQPSPPERIKHSTRRYP